MLFSRIGRQASQLDLVWTCTRRAPNPLNRAFPINLRCGVQTLAPNLGVGQSVRRMIYAKRAFGAGAIASIGFGVSAFTRPKVLCEAPPLGAAPKQEKEPHDTKLPPPPPQSSLSMFELTFGAVAGICAGVFVKKGAKAAAWFLGGIFVLLQFLVSKSFIKVDWSRMSSRFETTFYARDNAGGAKPPSVMSVWRWLIEFLTADFQPRASFIAGFTLGLRVG